MRRRRVAGIGRVVAEASAALDRQRLFQSEGAAKDFNAARVAPIVRASPAMRIDRPVTATPVGAHIDPFDPDLGAFRRQPTCKD